jgi:hypothetical protein
MYVLFFVQVPVCIVGRYRTAPTKQLPVFRTGRYRTPQYFKQTFQYNARIKQVLITLKNILISKFSFIKKVK